MTVYESYNMSHRLIFAQMERDHRGIWLGISDEKEEKVYLNIYTHTPMYVYNFKFHKLWIIIYFRTYFNWFPEDINLMSTSRPNHNYVKYRKEQDGWRELTDSHKTAGVLCISPGTMSHRL